MKPRTRVYLMLGVLIAGLAVHLGATPCRAADRSSRSIESGQPRDLINQPCWPPEEFEDAQRCEFAGKS
jgi:hypothetical protein